MPYRNGTFVGPTQINYDEYDPTSLKYRPENPNNDFKHDVQGPKVVSPLEEVAPGVFRGPEDNPGFGNYRQPDVYFPTSTPSMWDKFQGEFTKQMRGMMPTGIWEDQGGDQVYDPNGVGANVLLNTALGGGFVIPDMNGNAAAVLDTGGNLTIKTDDSNSVSIGGSGIGASYSPNDGITNISGRFNPGFGGAGVSGEINFEHNKLPRIDSNSKNVEFDMSALGLDPYGNKLPDPLDKPKVEVPQVTEARQEAIDRVNAVNRYGKIRFRPGVSGYSF
tara:strand:+ start:65 stop:892 length:828 start_codon:yes stop_codon:yes gene_type:complete